MTHVEPKAATTLAPDEETELIELTRALIRIDTINPPGNERAAAELLLERARAWGLQAELVPLSDGRANLDVRLPGNGNRPTLMYCGHLDTVPLGEEAWTHDPHEAHLDPDGVLWGRGASDMKGGVAAMLYGVALLARRSVQLPGDVRFLATIGEEVDCAGARAALAQGAMDEVGHLVIAEPTGMALVPAHKGALFLELTARGRAAHAAMPEQGINAISHLIRLLKSLEQLDFGVDEHHLLGRPTVSIGTITGGAVVNIVPDHCVAQVDVRTTPDVDHRKLVQVIEELVESHRGGGIELELQVTGDYPAVGTALGDSLVTAADAALSAVSGAPAPRAVVSYFSDGSILQPPTGVPTLLCGPGDPNLAHQTNERVQVSELVQAAGFFAELPQHVFERSES